ncbi:FAD-dependent oxidoreductase [Hyalangium minutum]|uniref:Ferredoxin reductase n=1 Tax=Hyalangium minutum TaxID=394096 RepID=A0A085WWL9_9BACT|nr:FAD-dependent oxidoreductase [Hyalangium minutum]KFE72082.1 Ferredoxin reductase [Hyalangium minutum]
MRVIVDLTRCQGYAQCAFLAPSVFKMQSGDALVYDPSPDESVREQVLRAAAACPVQAIHIREMATLEAVQKDAAKERKPAAPVHGTPAEAAFKRGGRIVIVGASLAGLRAAVALRTEGFAGSLTLIGDEAYAPYDRPPLSKEILTGWVQAERTMLPLRDTLDADWRLGVRAVGLDLAGKQVLLANGQTVEFDRLLIATGTRARPWPNEAEASLEGVEVLRTLGDAAQLQRRFAAKPGRVLVIGAGFVGSEVASACRELGLPVTVVERGAAPLVGVLGGVLGAVAADLQRDHGVDLRCGVTVTKLEGDASGRLRRAHLSDGSTLEVDIAVVALGAIRNVEWLRGSGLAATRWGVSCDTGCRAFDINGLVTDDVFVAGDVARFPHPLCDYQFLSLEHWGNALAQGEIAGHNMISAETDRWPHLAMPTFWSAQFGTHIKAVGVPTFADQLVITQGSLAERRFVAVYGYRGRITAAVAFDQAKWLEFYQGLIDAAAPFPPAFRTVDSPAEMLPVPAQIPDRTVLTQEATVVVTGREPYERRVQWLYRRR